MTWQGKLLAIVGVGLACALGPVVAEANHHHHHHHHHGGGVGVGVGTGYSGYNYNNYNYSNYGYGTGYGVGGYGGGMGGYGPAPMPRPNPMPLAPQMPTVVMYPMSANLPLRYMINGFNYTIQPGQQHTLAPGGTWQISFDRGGNFGPANFPLIPGGTYIFTLTPNGWDLIRN